MPGPRIVKLLATLCLLAALALPGAARAEADVVARLAADAISALRDGDHAAMTRWAEHYEHGEGVARDADAAVLLYCVAARAEHAAAAYGLGWMYANGRGVHRDDALAAGWMQRAAQLGDQHAARLLERLGAPADGARPRCVLAGGGEVMSPLVSVPDPGRARIVAWMQQLAPAAGIDPLLALAVVEVESGFNPRARSPKDARGLMQLIPPTARRFQVPDIWDPLANVRGGLAYLAWLDEHFDGRVEHILAGYNAGEQAVTRHGGIPPYRETRDYVRKVLRICRAAHAGRWRFELDPTRRRAAARQVAAVRPREAQGLTSCVGSSGS